jgi:hypothetical protein
MASEYQSRYRKRYVGDVLDGDAQLIGLYRRCCIAGDCFEEESAWVRNQRAGKECLVTLRRVLSSTNLRWDDDGAEVSWLTAWRFSRQRDKVFAHPVVEKLNFQGG